ncbi:MULTISPECIES: alpha-ketoglutarate-dependent dioxygenase AlkB family protein [Stenotrophomonas]|uniref:alpha-ketoglutarate-dependent dioxygenase AlkB family protein n=1 Tax=Stenotrophomonas TaxID=40323 RepID=UPI00066A3B6A|nr:MULTISPECIES: alpha-ketoglutarate-dependent dioxygenase AlkB [Stenotrophomonas]EKT4103270.1 alpha-ketoglutarate-dependent dioxygenase AlkB [Stenotrophomonas maltophilia]ELK2666623.1 alpha-ketoglutarate-dependent dioxygenase AlkB [Stenotrophomonas maltophilia]KUJ05445.1 DNA methylase [Stenotrophomonas maltophilia]MBA0260186.1 alpha-ketoglutarate-dependent dioxygenase AlkB [Stenotrophomonas maltophilia]MBA0314352.1 alpha-ketoglutarate-dependent dioxygenase AlkB [Stenotrophomonas maltophilia]
MLFPHDLPDADVQHRQAWLSPAEADALQRDLQAGVPWEVHRIRMFGHWVDSPRLSCWIGDPQARYRYSGAEFVPHPWPPSLQGMRERLQDDGLGRFNSVLLNRYRSGGDYMGWHSDDEPELGPAPVIASLSLGAARRFLLRRRDDPARKAEYLLGHGDLLVMAGQTQRHYQHALPKMARLQGERINLTFRWIAPR